LRIPNKKRSLSPPVTLNILSPSNKNRKKRHPFPTSQSINDLNSASNVLIPKIEPQSSSSLMRSIQYPITPPIDPRNPVTWNVNDVCWYLNESGCSFALKTIKEQVHIKSFFFIEITISFFC
jgi:hypothetical protein